MKESGEQCTVVFASIVTEYITGCVCPPPTHTNLVAGSVTIYAKTTVQCSPGFSIATTQSIKSARLDLYNRRNWVPPPPHPQGSVAHPSFGSKREYTLACVLREWGDPIPTKGQTFWYSMYICYNPATS
jgi:hypothetical protein